MNISRKVLPRLTEEEKMSCEGKLSYKECFEALQGMKHNKSPGYDGLTVEFYKHFWTQIKTLVVKSLNEGFDIEMIASSQRKGIITLLHKGKNLERDNLSNWRPITLLNVDYKIATRALAKRLQVIMTSIINSDQTGYVKGRYIGENVRLIEDVLRYTQKDEIPGVLLFLDFSKAFDSIDRNFLINLLKQFNFGHDFIKWIKTIYCNTSSCLVQNGIVSDFFTLEKGVRQGCPLSALLFVISIEILACKIRQCKEISGIKLPLQDYVKNEVKISMYADDITVFLTDVNDIKCVLDILRKFSKVSGLKLNSTKTKAMWIGSNKKCKRRPVDLRWKLYPCNNVKALGVNFSSTTPLNEVHQNWDSKVDKINNIIKVWKMRNLTMVGKILITKSLLSSQLTYISSVLTLPEHVIKDINKTLFQFVWGGSEKVKRKTIINSYECGGLKMLHLPSFLDSLKWSWIKRITNKNTANWKNIPLFEIQKKKLGLDILKCNCIIKSISEIYKNELNNVSTFYREVIELWLKCKQDLHEEAIENPGQEVIWNNECIKYNNNTLYFKDWIQSGIITVSNLYKENGSLMSMSDLQNIIEKPGGVMLEYLALLSSMPKKWKELRCLDTKNDSVNGLIYKTRYYKIEKCTSKLIRNILVSRLSVKPICEFFWKRKFNDYMFNWNNIWKNVPLITNEARLIALNWKILSNIYPTNIFLAKIGKARSSNCSKCDVEDYLEHFFFYCKSVKQLWNEVNSIIQVQMGKNVTLSVTTCLFGYYMGSQVENAFINKLIIIGKLCLSKFKYGNHPNLIMLLHQELRLRNIL